MSSLCLQSSIGQFDPDPPPLSQRIADITVEIEESSQEFDHESNQNHIANLASDTSSTSGSSCSTCNDEQQICSCVYCLDSASNSSSATGKHSRTSFDSTEVAVGSNKPAIEPSNISIGWRNLRFEPRRSLMEILSGTPPRVILKRLNGHLEYHSLNGFMGPSGAGKTTLLNCLNGNLRSGLSRETEIYLNRFENQSPTIGFIEQHVHETIVGRLTVREILRYAFLFKNGWKFSHRTASHIESIIKELMLDPQVLDRRFDRCSGGEQKRIAVAQELMSLVPPSFLFVDEPTTGLDSNAALLVMQCLRRLANRYRMTVTVSIHTPNAEIVQLFDKLYILAKGGVCIYSGPPYKLRQDFVHKTNKTNDPDDFAQETDDENLESSPPIEKYLKIACNGLENEQVRILADRTLEREYRKLSREIHKLDFLPWSVPRRLKRFSAEDFLLQLYRLFRLVFLVDARAFIVQIMIFTISYLGLTIMFDPDMTGPSGCTQMAELNNQTCAEQLQDDFLMKTYVNYQAFCLMFTGFGMVGVGAIVFAPLLKVFRNEHRNRWYSLGTFFWPYLLVRFIEMNIFTVINTVLVYFPSGHHLVDQILPSTTNQLVNWNRFGHFFGLFWLYNVYMQSIGQLVAVIFMDNVELSLITSYVYYIVLCLLNGYLLTLEFMNHPLVMKIAKLLASNVIGKALLWSFYGLDRCDQEGSFSIILYKYYVNPETVYQNLSQVAINVLILRIATIIIMFLRFSRTWQFKPMVQSRSTSRPRAIDYPIWKPSNRSRTPPQPRRIKQNIEIEFEQFVHDKVIVAWRHLTLFASSSIHEIRSVQGNEQEKMILRNLNGQCRFGTMNALMGTSGSGKTSLLKVLNGQLKTRLSDETRIYLSRFTPTRICYLTQEVSGHLMPGLTAKQSLIYASRCKNSPNTIGKDFQVDHEQVAMNLLEELAISETAETLVQNCSGGERKRLALALELTALRMPNLICIDEPTSGLDSNSADIVMACLKEFVHRHNITIVASIHQPNHELMQKFDQIYMLARGGVCIYSGPPNQIGQHLAKIQNKCIGKLPSKCSSFAVEELIQYSCMNHNDPIVERLVNNNDLNIIATDVQMQEQTQLVADGIPLNRIRFHVSSILILCSRYLAFIRGYLWYQWTMYLAIYISYAVILRSLFDPRIALTDGCISLEEDFNSFCNRTEEKIEEETNLTHNGHYNLFSMNIFIVLVMLQCGLSFIKEVRFFFNEHRNGWYSTGIFYITKYLFETLCITIIVSLYLWIVDIYEPIHPGIYWWMFLLLFLGVQGIQGLSHFLALLSNGNSFIFIALANFAYMFMIMTANIFNKISSLHYVFQIVSNLSTCRFIDEGNLVLQYGFGRCREKQIQAILFNLEIPNSDHHHYDHLYHCIRMLIAQIFLYRLMALAALVAKSNPLANRRRRAERIIKFHEQMKPSNAIIPGLSSHMEFSIKTIHSGQNKFGLGKQSQQTNNGQQQQDNKSIPLNGQ